MTADKKRSKRKIIIVGTGGHSRVVVSVLSRMGHYQVVGLLDRNEPRANEKILGVPVIGEFGDLPALYKKGVRLAALAIGDNDERRQLFTKLKQVGFDMPPLIHPGAHIEQNVMIGEGALICDGAIITSAGRIGEGSIINTGSIIDHETIVGPFVHIAPGCSIAGRVKIGQGTFIGIGSSVIDRISIGEGAVVGAGSVVVNDIPNKVTVYGAPARLKK
ncbi:MAG: acetyltransferase [Elusimicrobia bacterium]|nr:acetyltransferase [Candidatus Obscuribacterium magneticum]